MFFTNFARMVAWLVLVGSVMRIVTGVGIATEILGPYEEALRRYGGRAESSGAIIDRGVYALLVAIALGTLAEISRSVRGPRE
ncbi:hypothetical protein [Rhizobium ruizarguesonis]|uniref:hypothetical protein n=1 Tax=Rhizobium ruizarguesonis TaxID=2081791 RepID=UPI0003FD2286|nr:hypothetical protein [Rhizobium ruizarguesonis]QJS27160.1 hypothetical protein RLTA1_07555 [Rhizobium leguminosarum bv. trifolii TA1]UFW95901.1 hypothetical protein RlegTA1_07535 [Rhizobium ruizarguesonis]